MKTVILVLITFIALTVLTEAQSVEKVITYTATRDSSQIDTLSRHVTSTTNDLYNAYVFRNEYKVFIFSPVDTLDAYWGSTAAFTAGKTETILPGYWYPYFHKNPLQNQNLYTRKHTAVLSHPATYYIKAEGN